MKMNLSYLSRALGLGLCLLPMSAHAQFLKRFDIGAASTPVQAGYVGLTVTNGSPSPSLIAADNEVAIQLTSSTGSFLSRTRGALGGTFSDLYRDFAAPSAEGATLTTYLWGLTLNTVYDVTFHAYDSALPSGGNRDLWTDATPGGSGHSSFITYGGADPSASLFGSAITISAIAKPITIPGGGSATGLVFTSVGVGGAGGDLLQRFNGLQIVASSAPEPGSMALLALGGGLLVARGKRGRR
jgi:hypothetical protein